MIMGNDVLIPCPISELGATSVTAPLGAMLTNTLGAKSAAGASAAVLEANASAVSNALATINPPPTSPLILMNWRRSICW
jgi:hypothetical protein